MGLKTSLESPRFSLGMVTKFASQPHARMEPGKVVTCVWMAHKSQSILMCDHRAHNLLVLRSPQFSFTLGPRSSYGHKSVLAICVFLAYKRRVGNIISVETLVQRLPGLPDLLHQP